MCVLWAHCQCVQPPACVGGWVCLPHAALLPDNTGVPCCLRPPSCNASRVPPKSLQLSTQQKLALQALWRRVKEAQGVLLAQHDALLEQLEGLQQLQAAEQQLFAQQAHELPIMKLAQSLLHWRQQQLKPEAVPSPSHQDKQQQQQQRHLSPPSSAALELCDPTNMLLPPPSADERKLEQHLAALRESVALGQQLLTAQLLSCLTHKQLAHLLVCSWPFCPDSIAVRLLDSRQVARGLLLQCAVARAHCGWAGGKQSKTGVCVWGGEYLNCAIAHTVGAAAVAPECPCVPPCRCPCPCLLSCVCALLAAAGV